MICKLNQWTGFYMIGTSVIKELTFLVELNPFLNAQRSPTVLSLSETYLFCNKAKGRISKWR